MKLPTLNLSNLPRKKLLIASSIAVGAVMTPFITYACYQNYVKPETPKNLTQQSQQEEKKTEDPKPVAATPAVAPAPAPAVAKPVTPAAKPKPAPVKTKTESKSETPIGGVSSISLHGSGESVGWSVAGYSKKGFKVVWSKVAGPTYPTRSSDEYHYLSNPGTVADYIDAFDGPGQYYVRVCEYLGGGCGVYSNQIVVTLN